ncbi:protein split ends isoform X1 [Cotesia glomerata]|uniref:protein split ends isoform X1 n=1 Tax=Cotesia glomerata TaxID=32391 RepID=UPI001D0332A2|nr:protein split ends isoform X1 [Cotesia glomerata]
MVRETRHLWVGNLPENIREDRIREHFKRYGRVQSVKLLPRGEECPVDGASGGSLGEGSEGGSGTGSGSGSAGGGSTSSGGASATVAFMDIKSAAKAHAIEHTLDERALTTQYYEPQLIQHRFPSHGNSEDHGTSVGVSVVGSGVSGNAVNVGVSERGVERVSETFESRVSHGNFYPGERSNRVEHSVDSSAVDPVASYMSRSRPTPSSGYHVTAPRARERLYPRTSSYVTGPPPSSHLDRHRGAMSMSSWLGYESGSTRYSTGPPQQSPAATDNYQEESDIHVNINSLSTQLVGQPSIRPSWDIPSRSAFLSGGGVNSGSGVSISSCGGGGVVGTGGGVSSGGSGGGGGNSGSSMRQHKKQRRKSRSGSSSPSGSSRSGSSSSSRSNSSAGSTSGDSSSPGSSPHRTGNAAVSDDRRPLAICVRNLPARSSDTSLKDGLFHEYKKHGKVTWVKVVGAAGDRYALVCFKKPEDVEKALEVSHDKLFFGCKIEVAPYQGYDVEDNEFRPYEAELDEYHPKATRTLFIGNLEKDVTQTDLRNNFEQFGEIIEIDIKKQGAVSSYAFCQYADISSVVKAMRSMDGEHLGSNRIKLGFGKSMPTTCVWVDGIGECVSEKYLNMQFHQFGPINQAVIDRERGHALVFYEQMNCAQVAVKEMRGASLRGRRLQVDFASRELQESFYEHLERQGVTGEKPWDSRPSPAATFDVARERSFEAAVTVPNAGSRFTRYETPPRARTASYSRTPGGGSTPGASPAHPTAMSRTSRRSYQADPYYEGDYTEPTSRRFRSYDEFSQGSGASHDDYESSVLGDSKLNDDDLLPPPRRHAIQSVVTSVEPPVPSSLLLPPPDIRHLQKERVHLLEQLEECHSSGDEGFAPKKRPKLDSSSAILCDDDEPEIASLLVTSHSGRKGMDVRRVSDSKILVHHNTRRGSCEGRGPGPCKRRRDTSSRHHEHHDSSRPGTPLVDERPENIIPSEPRRFRERSQEGPLSLPLPRFAAQMMNNNNTSNSNNNNTNNNNNNNNNNSICSLPMTITTASVTITTTTAPATTLIFSTATTTTAGTITTTTSTSAVDLSRVKQRKDGGSRESRDSKENRDSRHSRSKDGSRKTKKDDNDSEKIRNKERDDKDERSLSLSSSSGLNTAESTSDTLTATDTHNNRDIKESKEARYERKEREERERRDKEERERQERRDKEDRDKLERKEREERERREKDEERREKERLEKERRDREERERDRERKEREEIEAREKDKREKERLEKERKDREEKDKQERRDREERERKEREVRLEREKQEKERLRKEREEFEKREKEERERVERERRREEKEKIDRERKREREERERLERERRKEKEERERVEKEKREKEEKEKVEKVDKVDKVDKVEKDKHEREKRERREREDLEKREKEKIVEHAKRRDRDDKDKDKDSKREREETRRQPVENHHMGNQNQVQVSSPAPVSLKRRCSSQETPQDDESNKRMKISDHRRDSKDRPRQNRRSEDRKHRNDSHRTSRESRENRDSKDSSTSTQSQESRESREPSLQSHGSNELPGKDVIISSSREIKECRENRESRDSRESRESRDSRENRDNNRDIATSGSGGGSGSNSGNKDKQRSKRNRLERERMEKDRSPRVSHELDKEFLSRIELAKRTDNNGSPPNRVENNNQTGGSHHHHHHHHHHHRESQREHHHVSINLHSDNDDGHSSNHEMQTRHPSQTDTDSDEPKKHSIFDIVDDEPAYISMYDKVKARSTKNMQKLEEEKRQVRLKDKFSQLKQSRARREEKKQSTSWDGDSVSSKALTEDEGTSESDSTRAKSLSRKGSRSRIHSDTSEEDESFNNKVHKIKTERFLESDVDLGFADTEEKHTPTESSSINSLRTVKQEPRSSDDDERIPVVSFPSNHPAVNNHQRDSRKKSHKKKQKRQKLSISSEEGSINIKIESPDSNEHKRNEQTCKNIISTSDCRVNHVNDSTAVTTVALSSSVAPASAEVSVTSEERIRAEKKQRNKKDKRRERTSEDKAKTRRKRLNRQEARDSQRMEDIFGPLSDDVDDAPTAPFFNRLGGLPSENNAYGSDSDGMRSPILDVDRVRRKAEKKRRHQIEDENSVDLAEAGREIEANLLGLPVSPKPAAVCNESNDHDVFRFTDDNDSVEPSTPTTAPEKVKEKKKKRKKSKEERSRKDYHHHHHHHHHHHDKAGALPYLGADPSPPRASSPISRKTVSPPPLPVPRDTILSPIPKIPTTTSTPATTTVTTPTVSSPSVVTSPTIVSSKSEKKKDKFIPGFGMDIDEKIHENAIKSISEPEERESGRQSGAGNHEPEPPAPATPPPQVEDKPRVVISQEETEDAVAALLEETFGVSTEDFSYEGDEEEPEGDGASVPPPDAPQEDVDEMQQAVDSLNASTGAETDADLKPDTPQSEHDLQIDTDTEEDPNYESFDLTQPPKTPDIPSFYKSPVSKQSVITTTAVTTTTTTTTTPVENTPNCTTPSPVAVRSPSPPASVISHSWTDEHKPPKAAETPEAEAGNKDRDRERERERASVATPSSPPGQYKPPMPCSLPIISNEAPRLSAASPRPPVTSSQPLYQRLPVSLQSQMVPPLRQTPPRMSVAVTTSPSVTVPTTMTVQPRPSTVIPSQAPALSPNGQWSRNIPISSHLSHGIKTPSITSTTCRIPVSVPITAPIHRDLSNQHIYSTAASQQPVIQHAPGMRALAPSYPRGGLPPLTLNIPPRPYMPVPPLVSGIPRDSGKPRDSMAFGGKSVIETLIPGHLNESPQRLEEPKLSPAVIPEPTNKASTSPKVPSPNQPPTFIPETAKIEISASTSTPAISKPAENVLSPRQKQLPVNNAIELSTELTKKPELTNVHLLTTHPPHTSAPSPVIVAHGQHLVHKSVVHSLIPTTVTPNQPLIKTVVPVVSQFSQAHVALDKPAVTPIVTLAGQQQQQQRPPISQGVLLIKPHIPLVSTVSQSITRVSTCVTSMATPIISPPQPKPTTPEAPAERQERFTDIQKTKTEATDSATVQTKFLPSPEVKQEDVKPPVDLVKEESKPVEVEVKVEKIESETAEIPAKVLPEIVPKDEPLITEPPKEIKQQRDEEEEPKCEEDEEDTADEARESNDPLVIDSAREDPADSKEDSDYWSAKEVNIESVIKTVDALCDGEVNDEVHDDDDSHNDQETNGESHDTSKGEDWPDTESTEGDSKKDFSNNDEQDEGVETSCEIEPRSRRVRSKTRRGGGRGGVSNRRVNRTAASGKRGGRTPRNSKQEKNKLPADVYEFHDDSEEDNAGRPRLILTIKSPGPTAAAGPNAQPVAAVKEVAAEEFVSPATNTRKSKRLAEKDISRTTVDDTIEDVVRGSAPNKALLGVQATRRSTRHNNGSKPLQPQLMIVETRKSRGGRRTSRRTSETNEDSGEEKSKDPRPEAVITSAPSPVSVTTTTTTTRSDSETTETASVAVPETPVKQGPEPVKQLPALGQKSSLEPMTLIDPVTGMLIPMRESEEGQYIPVSTASGQIQNIPRSLVEARTNIDVKGDKFPPTLQPAHPRPVEESKAKVPEAPPNLEPADLSQPCKTQTSVITKSQASAPAPTVQVTSSVVVQPTMTPPVSTSVLTNTPTNLVTSQCKPTSLKAHVLNPSKLASTPVAQQIVVSKPVTPSQPAVQNIIKQPNQAMSGLRLQIPAGRVSSPGLSPRGKQPVPISSANGKPGQPMSPVLNSSNIPPNPKQHLLQAAKQQQQQQQQQQLQQQQQTPTIVNMQQKMGINAHPSNVATTPVQRIHNPISQATNLKGINGQTHLPSPKAHLLQAVAPNTIMSGGVASPPTQPHIIGAQAVVSVASCSRSIAAKPQIAGMEPPKVEVSMSGCIMVPNASPSRVSVPYEAALHGPPGAAPSPGGQYGLVPPHRTQSPPLPPPAHHHTNASQGDVVNHYGGLSRAGELPPPYMLPLPYQFLRAQQEAALTTPRIAYHVPDARSPHLPLDPKMEASGEESHSPPLELVRATRTPHDRTTDSPQVAQVYMMHGGQRLPAPPQYNTGSNPVFAGGPTGARGPYYEPPPAHIRSQYPMAASEAPDRALTPDRHRKHQVATPPHASQVPPQADSLLMLLRRYPVMWQGLLALKNDQAAVQMHFVFGNPNVATESLPCNSDRSTPPLRIAQRMRLEQTQVDGVARKMQTDNEHCMLLALPCGRDQMDVLQQSKNLQTGFITYLQQKQAAGIVNIAAPGSQQPAYVVHIFPSCDFANESLARIAPDLLHRVAEIAHLVIVIATV